LISLKEPHLIGSEEKVQPFVSFLESEERRKTMKGISFAKLIKNLARIMMIVFIIGAGFLVMKVEKLERVVNTQDQTIQQLETALDELSSRKAEMTNNEHLQQVDEKMKELAQTQAALQQAFNEFSDSMRPAKLLPNASPAMRIIAEFLLLPNDCTVYDDSEGFPKRPVPIVAISYWETPDEGVSYIHVSNEYDMFRHPPFWEEQKGWWWDMPNAAHAIFTCSQQWEAYQVAHEFSNALSDLGQHLRAYLQPNGSLIIKGTIVVPQGDRSMIWQQWVGPMGETIEDATLEVKSPK
jgi:uncharacterized membrane-anchored protein YhcB (DUF1043 family)